MHAYGKPEKERRSPSSGPIRPDIADPKQRFKPLPDPDPAGDEGPLPVDERLAMRGVGFRSQVRSKNTLAAYKRDFEHFKAWCQANTYRALPASAQTVEFYLNDNWSKFAISTLERRLIGIAHAHKRAGHESPTKDDLVRETFKGIRRAAARQGRNRPEQALPLLMDDIAQLVSHLDLSTLRGLRDRVVLLIGFAAAFRAEEQGSIQVQDLKKHRRGYLIHLRKSKTDQEGKLDPIAIPMLDDKSVCPAHAIEEWLRESGIVDGPVLRYIDRHGNVGKAGLSSHGISYIVKRCVKSAGWETDGYSGHSLRAGLATTAHLAGASELDIKKQGRWKSDVVRDYIRKASLFDNNAAATAMVRPKA